VGLSEEVAVQRLSGESDAVNINVLDMSN
jgi:hypothetical protein